MNITLQEIQDTGLPLSDHGGIAAALSEGRVKLVPTEVGKGRIIATIGLASANALLDVIDASADFRHVKQLVENGWLDIGSPLVRATLDSLAVAGVITEAETEALKALAVQPDPVSILDVSHAIELGV